MVIKQITLTGERVVLRPWQDRDADAFAAMNADERVMEFFVAPLARGNPMSCCRACAQ